MKPSRTKTASACRMRLDKTAHFSRLFFTPEVLAALRRMMAGPRLANPQKFAHMRRELGIDPGRGTETAERSRDS